MSGMDVTLAVLADYANLPPDNKLNIIGVFRDINPPALPFVLPMMFLVVQYEAPPSEINTEKRFEIKLLDSEGGEILKLEQTTIVPHPGRPGTRVTMSAVLGFNGIKFEQPGDYQFAILVNGEEKRTIPLRVNEPPPSGEE